MIIVNKNNVICRWINTFNLIKLMIIKMLIEIIIPKILIKLIIENINEVINYKKLIKLIIVPI